MRLRYTGIRVADLRRAVRFYTKGLGLKEVDRGDGHALGLGRWVLLEDRRTGQQLELYLWRRGARRSAHTLPPAGLRHLGFDLGPVGAEELEQAYRRLLRLGARKSKITPGKTAGWIGWVTDPDGNWVELARSPTRERTATSTGRRPRRQASKTARNS